MSFINEDKGVLGNVLREAMKHNRQESLRLGTESLHGICSMAIKYFAYKIPIQFNFLSFWRLMVEFLDHYQNKVVIESYV